jgi:hypothetical protein
LVQIQLIITRMQFPIQLVITRTIHQTQRLTLDQLTFDHNGVYKHDLTYITFSCIKNKENLYILQPLQMIFFQINPNVTIEMH